MGRSSTVLYILGMIGFVVGFDQGEHGPLADHELKLSEEAGYSYIDRLTQLEEELYAQGQYVKEDSPFYRMAQFKKPMKEALELSLKATRMLEATKFLKTRFNRDENSLMVSSNFSIINGTCLAKTKCSLSKYRSVNGSCNSLNITNLGMSFTDYRRLASPAYADGIQSPRVATNGSALPSARVVSLNVFAPRDQPMTTATLALMQFGQFINHDMQSTTQFTFTNGTDISCCSSTGGSLNASQLYPACLPISVPADDKFFNLRAKKIQTCMNFVRSIAGPRLDCSLGYADQLNQNTHWLDGSTIYGSTNATLATLRTYSGGLLKTTNDTVNKRQLLPQTSPCTTRACFYAGDSRATEQPQLTVMHTLWMREHNRVAKSLSALNPTWSDESVFQEARRIVIAEIQHITYNEFIPGILSSATITKYGLAPSTTGYMTNYTNITSGPISNEFATAAFRMGHSLVQGTVQLYAENGTMLNSSYSMSNTFNDASMIVNDPTYFDAVIRGLMVQPSQAIDIFVVDELWNKLFRATNKIFGFDVVALNIQRGRDHGLPSYNTYRQLCGFTKLTSFADLTARGPNTPTFSSPVAGFINASYASVDDIDLYVGGLGELGGNTVGPTFNCLMGENFNKLKYTDRYFYEIGGQPHSFSASQLAEIKKASLARIFCDNSDGTVLSAQPKAFVPVNNSTNSKVRCSDEKSIPKLNLALWKGEKLF